jgi:hypothetical protein
VSHGRPANTRAFQFLFSWTHASKSFLRKPRFFGKPGSDFATAFSSQAICNTRMIVECLLQLEMPSHKRLLEKQKINTIMSKASRVIAVCNFKICNLAFCIRAAIARLRNHKFPRQIFLGMIVAD